MLQVLPHLLEEVRSEQLQQLVLPLVIHILGKQDKQVTHSVQHAQLFNSQHKERHSERIAKCNSCFEQVHNY